MEDSPSDSSILLHHWHCKSSKICPGRHTSWAAKGAKAFTSLNQTAFTRLSFRAGFGICDGSLHGNQQYKCKLWSGYHWCTRFCVFKWGWIQSYRTWQSHPRLSCKWGHSILGCHICTNSFPALQTIEYHSKFGSVFGLWGVSRQIPLQTCWLIWETGRLWWLLEVSSQGND